MATAGVDQKELKKLLKSLKQFTVRVQKNVVVGSTRAAANVVRDEMRERVPKDTGALKKSIKSKKRRSKKTEVKFSVKAGKGQTHKAFFLEYGTKNMSPHPFIRPSLYAVGNKPVEAARSYFKPALVKQKKKLGLK